MPTNQNPPIYMNVNQSLKHLNDIRMCTRMTWTSRFYVGSHFVSSKCVGKAHSTTMVRSYMHRKQNSYIECGVAVVTLSICSSLTLKIVVILVPRWQAKKEKIVVGYWTYTFVLFFPPIIHLLLSPGLDLEGNGQIISLKRCSEAITCVITLFQLW